MIRRIAPIALLFLAACSGEHVQAHMFRTGVVESFRYAARDGDIHVAILNNPFAADRATVEANITGSMTGHNAAQVKRFLAVPEGGPQPPARVVMLFNPPLTANGLDLCDARAPAGGATGERLRLLTSFCVGNQAQSQAIASMPAPASPADARFHTMIQQTMLNLIPLSDRCAANNCDFNDE